MIVLAYHMLGFVEQKKRKYKFIELNTDRGPCKKNTTVRCGRINIILTIHQNYIYDTV